MGTVVISGNTYPIYGTEAGFKAYLAGHVASNLSADANANKRALVSAARWLDRGRWLGTKVDPDQALAFEFRAGLITCDGVPVPTNEIAPGVVEAAYELANYLLSDASLPGQRDNGSNVRTAAAGSARVEFFRPTSGPGTGAGLYPREVLELMRCYITSGTAASGEAFGDDQDSQFDSDDFYGLVGPL